jgi:hypothetical protein
MAKKLMILADLGRLKAYHVNDDRNYSHPRLELLEDWETNVTQHLSEELSDQAGQFRKTKGQTDGNAALSDGEQHNLDLERKRRALKVLVKRISELLDGDEVGACYLAADNRINQAILNEMDHRLRGKIQKNVTSNLTRLKPAELLAHFAG